MPDGSSPEGFVPPQDAVSSVNNVVTETSPTIPSLTQEAIIAAAKVPATAISVLDEVRQEGIDQRVTPYEEPKEEPSESTEGNTSTDENFSGGLESASSEGGVPENVSQVPQELPFREYQRQQWKMLNGVLGKGLNILSATGKEEDAKLAADFKDPKNQSRDGLRSIVNTLDVLQFETTEPGLLGQIQDVNVDLGQNVVISSDRGFFTLEQLRNEAADKDTTPGRHAEIDAILKEGEYEVSYDVDRSFVEASVAMQAESLRETIKDLKERAQPTEQYEALLARFEIAQQCEGDAGAILGVNALNTLNETGAVKGLKPVLERGERVKARSQKMMVEELRGRGYKDEQISDILNKVEKGDIRELVKDKRLRETNIDQLIFGSKFSDPELMDRLKGVLSEAQRRALLLEYGKDAGFALLVMLLGSAFGQLQKSLG